MSPVLEKIRATRAGNEQSEFLGSVSIAQERAATQIADNPGMPFEEMDKIQEQMMKEIDKAGESLTLPESKNYARNFTLKNRELIEEKFNTQKEAILTRHETTRFNLERERLIAERKPDELNKLYDSVSGELLDPEVATLAFKNDVLTIDALQAKFDVEVAKAGHQNLLEQFAEAGRGMELSEATDFFNKISREIITDPERRSLIAQRKTQDERLLEEQKIIQQQTADKILTDIWDGKITNPQDVTDALDMGVLNNTDAKYLHNLLMNPAPAKLNLLNLSTVKKAIEDIGTGAGTREDALSTLYANLDSIDPTTGKSLLSEIYAEHDKYDSEIKRESRDLMEELVRDREPISGMFEDDERQILGAAEAYLMLDTEIKKAAEEGKPLNRREIMIKAVQIGRQIKKKIKAPREPEFTAKGKPITKGALAKPDFALDSEGEPEKVFDSEGREIGLRRKTGATFKIGYIATFAGKKYEYTGNGNWKLVK